MGRIKYRLIQYLTRNLLKAISEDDILQISSRAALLHKRNLSVGEVTDLREEAKTILESQAWELMMIELEGQAHQFIFYKARNWNDSVFGRAMLHNLEMQRRFMKRIRSL